MPYILFGVIAVVGIIFLIIYNLRMEAKHKKAQTAQEEVPAQPSMDNVQENASDDAKILVEDAREHGKLVEDAHPHSLRNIRTEKTSDLEYREALRTFRVSEEGNRAQEQEDREEEKEQDIPMVPPEQKADDQFREAIRSMKK